MSETIGQKIRSLREEKRLSLEQVSAATRIRLHYLEALERDDLSSIPSAAQARGFLRIYADFLGINPDEFALMPRQPEPAALTPLKAEPPAAPVQESISTSAPARPNLLTSLRERFSRRSKMENIPADASREQEQSAMPEPEFVPARYTEELPAEPAPVAPAPVVIEEPAMQEPMKPAKRSSRRGTTAATSSSKGKKPAPKKAKAGKKSEVKKKIT